MEPNLETTNLLLGIMAAVSVLQALVLIGAAVAGYLAYRKVMRTVDELETRQLAPITAKVNDILLDVKSVSARVSQQTERVDQAIAGTMERVDETAERVRSNVRQRAGRAVGIVQGLRAALVTLLNGGSERRPPHAAAGRV
jgi:methyl-accepting chemotaxis protein